MPLWPCQSDYPLRVLSTGQSVGYPEYDSQSAPFGIPGIHGALTIVCMCVIQLKSSGLPISLAHTSRATPPSKSRCYCVAPVMLLRLSFPSQVRCKTVSAFCSSELTEHNVLLTSPFTHRCGPSSVICYAWMESE